MTSPTHINSPQASPPTRNVIDGVRNEESQKIVSLLGRIDQLIDTGSTRLVEAFLKGAKTAFQHLLHGDKKTDSPNSSHSSPSI